MGDILLRARHAVLGNVEAHLVAFCAGIFAPGQRVVDLGAHLLAYGRTLLKALVISAGVERHGHVEDLL